MKVVACGIVSFSVAGLVVLLDGSTVALVDHQIGS